ncbi:hypothetical protein BH23CHL7_BH23CHL7_08200 [soil metagenome]
MRQPAGVPTGLWGERGPFDILAFHPATGTLLVVEIKTDLPSVEGTLRKLDEKVRLAPEVAAKRLGWQVRNVARVLVMPNTRTLRRRVTEQEPILKRALPQRNVVVKRWLGAPSGSISGLMLVSG